MSQKFELSELNRELDARSENLITRVLNLRAANDRLERELAAANAKLSTPARRRGCGVSEGVE